MQTFPVLRQGAEQHTCPTCRKSLAPRHVIEIHLCNDQARIAANIDEAVKHHEELMKKFNENKNLLEDACRQLEEKSKVEERKQNVVETIEVSDNSQGPTSSLLQPGTTSKSGSKEPPLKKAKVTSAAAKKVIKEPIRKLPSHESPAVASTSAGTRTYMPRAVKQRRVER